MEKIYNLELLVNHHEGGECKTIIQSYLYKVTEDRQKSISVQPILEGITKERHNVIKRFIDVPIIRKSVPDNQYLIIAIWSYPKDLAANKRRLVNKAHEALNNSLNKYTAKINEARNNINNL